VRPLIGNSSAEDQPSQSKPQDRDPSIEVDPQGHINTGVHIGSVAMAEDLPAVSKKEPQSEKVLLFRHQTISSVASQCKGDRQTAKLITHEYRTRPEFYPSILTTEKPPDSDAYQQLNDYLFSRMESAIASEGGIQALHNTLHTPKENRSASQKTNLIEITAAYQLAVEANIPWALLLAAKIGPTQQFTMDSVRQAAIKGLTDAVTRYDRTKGSFANYATSWINLSIQRTRNHEVSTVKLTGEDGLLYDAIRKSIQVLTFEKGGQFPTLEEVAFDLDVDISAVRLVWGVGSPFISLDDALPATERLIVESPQGKSPFGMPDKDSWSLPDGASFADIFSSPDLDKAAVVLTGLEHDLAPSYMPSDLRIGVKGQEMTYKEIYERFCKQAMQDQASGKAYGRAYVPSWRTAARKVLGMKFTTMGQKQRECYAKLQEILIERYGEDFDQIS
jgi:DNA-directed RNA polymerase sigma subunit (sigma70/sigma32)